MMPRSKPSDPMVPIGALIGELPTLRDIAIRTGIDPDETEASHQGKRSALMARVDHGDLDFDNLSAQDAWYLPSAVLDATFYRWREGKPAQPPSCAWYGLPLPLETVDLVHREELDSTRILDIVRDWVKHVKGSPRPKTLLMLAGGTGIGKTVAAAWALRRFGREGRYTKARELVQLHGSAWSETRAEYQDLLRAGLLVIDEVGAEVDPEKAKASLHDTIDERQGRPTMVITNLAWPEMRKRLDARTVDRIREIGALRWIDGASMRRAT